MAEEQTSKTRAEFEKDVVLKAWRDSAFKEELLKDPKGTLERQLQELHAEAKLPEDLEVEVLEESTKKIYLVVPQHPEELTDRDISDEELEAVAGGTIAVAVVVAVGVEFAAVAAQLGEAVQEAAQVQAQAQVHVQVQAVQG